MKYTEVDGIHENAFLETLRRSLPKKQAKNVVSLRAARCCIELKKDIYLMHLLTLIFKK